MCDFPQLVVVVIKYSHDCISYFWVSSLADKHQRYRFIKIPKYNQSVLFLYYCIVLHYYVERGPWYIFGTRAVGTYLHFKVILTQDQTWSAALLGGPTPASFILSATLLKNPARHSQVQSNQREKAKRPLALSVLKVLQACVTLNSTAHLYDPLPSCGITKNSSGTHSLSKGRWTEQVQEEKKWRRQAAGKWESNAFWVSNVQ